MCKVGLFIRQKIKEIYFYRNKTLIKHYGRISVKIETFAL